MSIKQWYIITPDEEIQLPIPPSKYSITEGLSDGTINLLNYGEVDVDGNKTLTKFSISSFFPNRQYEFYQGTFQAPQAFINKFRTLKNNNTICNLMITGSEVALKIKIKSIMWGEEDGTGDIYYSMDLLEHRELSDSSGSTSSSTLYNLPVGTYAYTIEENDSLTKIAKWYYGDSSKYTEIAERNNIKNPNSIYPNQVVYL